jgi:hypothetical protein
VNKATLIKSHFFLLGTIVLLELLKVSYDLYLLSILETSIKIAWFTSGVILFFIQQGLRRAYFALFPLTLVISALLFVFKGFLAMIVLFGLFTFIFQPTTKFKHHRVIIKQESVIMSPATYYSVYKRSLIFETKMGEFQLENQHIPQKISSTRDREIITIKINYLNRWDSIPGDTSITLVW